MKVGQIIRLLKADGWFLVNASGSHRQFKHSVKTGRVTIAGKYSNELPPGTLKSILKQAKLKVQK